MNSERFQRAINLALLRPISEQMAKRENYVITASWRRAATTMPLDMFHPPLDIRVFIPQRGEGEISATGSLNGDELYAVYEADPEHAIQRINEAIHACVAQCEALFETKKGKNMDNIEDRTPVTVKQNTVDGKYYVWETEYPDEGAVAVLDSDPSPEELRALHPTYVRYVRSA